MKLKSLSRKLRRQATDVEHLLWNYLRARQLAGFKFRRQVAIEPYLEHTDAVLEQIQRALINIPSPQPSPEGRGS